MKREEKIGRLWAADIHWETTKDEREIDRHFFSLHLCVSLWIREKARVWMQSHLSFPACRRKGKRDNHQEDEKGKKEWCCEPAATTTSQWKDPKCTFDLFLSSAALNILSQLHFHFLSLCDILITRHIPLFSCSHVRCSSSTKNREKKASQKEMRVFRTRNNRWNRNLIHFSPAEFSCLIMSYVCTGCYWRQQVDWFINWTFIW